MASTLEVGKKFVELCKQGKNVEAVEQLYAPNIVSIEAKGNGQMPPRMEGLAAIKGKNEWWVKNHQIHGGEAFGPWPHGDRFIVHYKFDVTPTSGPFAGKRMQLEEAGLYTVRDGKIVQEEFFYDM